MQIPCIIMRSNYEQMMSEESHHIVITVNKQIHFIYLLYIDKVYLNSECFITNMHLEIPGQLMWEAPYGTSYG